MLSTFNIINLKANQFLKIVSSNNETINLGFQAHNQFFVIYVVIHR